MGKSSTAIILTTDRLCFTWNLCRRPIQDEDSALFS